MFIQLWGKERGHLFITTFK